MCVCFCGLRSDGHEVSPFLIFREQKHNFNPVSDRFHALRLIPIYQSDVLSSEPLPPISVGNPVCPAGNVASLREGEAEPSRAELTRLTSDRNENMKLFVWILMFLLRSHEGTCGNGECSLAHEAEQS